MLVKLETFERSPSLQLCNISYETARLYAQKVRLPPQPTPKVCISTCDKQFAEFLNLLHAREQVAYYGELDLNYTVKWIESCNEKIVFIGQTCTLAGLDTASQGASQFGEWQIAITDTAS